MLLRFSPENTVNVEELGRSLAGQFERLAHGKAPEAQLKQIPVVYDGDDLESLAEEKNLPVDELIRLHSEPTYKVYLLGFSPGFPYLGELHPRLHAPRRASPRTRVPAGSVAIGGEHTGIYSVDSPGGWRIIGRTPVKLFDPDQLAVQQSPKDLFFLIPGDRVRFVPTKG
jgi:inhibitor of KinA